jgi:exodeoxyribonuclease VII large subunit
MGHALAGRVREGHQRLDDLSLRVLHETRIRRQAAAQDVKRLGTQLKALNPLAVLERGYSVTRDAQGRLVRSVDGLEVGQAVSTRVARGAFESRVTGTTAEE